MAKILLHSLVYTPDRNSTAYLLSDLMNQLTSFGHDIIVLTTTPHNNPEPAWKYSGKIKKLWGGLLYCNNLNGIVIWHIKLPMKGKRIFTRIYDFVYFHFMALLVGTTQVGKYDIVIAPSPPLSIGIVGWLLSKRRKVPFVYNIQELYPDFAVNQGIIKNKVLIFLLRFLEKSVYNHTTKLVPISESFRTIIQTRGVVENKICVIPNFVDVNSFPILPRDNGFLKKYNLVKSFNVYYGGNIGLSQDWESLLWAANTVSHLQINFIITGDGASREWLEKAIGERNIKNIIILGYQEKEIIPQVYASSNLCIIPMKPMTTLDTFPSKVYSIMASGKAVLAQADPDSELWWLINESNCGRVIPPGDPQKFTDELLRAYNEPEKLIIEGESGREYVKSHYSLESVAKRYHLLIKSLTEMKSLVS